MADRKRPALSLLQAFWENTHCCSYLAALGLALRGVIHLVRRPAGSNFLLKPRVVPEELQATAGLPKPPEQLAAGMALVERAHSAEDYHRHHRLDPKLLPCLSEFRLEDSKRLDLRPPLLLWLCVKRDTLRT